MSVSSLSSNLSSKPPTSRRASFRNIQLWPERALTRLFLSLGKLAKLGEPKLPRYVENTPSIAACKLLDADFLRLTPPTPATLSSSGSRSTRVDSQSGGASQSESVKTTSREAACESEVFRLASISSFNVDYLVGAFESLVFQRCKERNPLTLCTHNYHGC